MAGGTFSYRRFQDWGLKPGRGPGGSSNIRLESLGSERPAYVQAPIIAAGIGKLSFPADRVTTNRQDTRILYTFLRRDFMRSMVQGLLLPILGVAAILPHGTAADAAGPTTSVQGEYLMTLYAPIAEAHDVDDRLRWSTTQTGGWKVRRSKERSFRLPATR
jgi:hypothetical protein